MKKLIFVKSLDKTGDCSGLSGNFDLCEITAEERCVGIKISDLIGGCDG